MQNYDVKEGKTMAIISYITWIGTLIAFIMNNDKRNYFASFHIRQAIGISVLSLLNTFIISRFTGPWTVGIVVVVILVLRLIGLIGAIQSEEKKVPLFGDLFQDWFRNVA